VIEHGKDGLLVQPGNVDELASAIYMLLTDQPLRTFIGLNARQKYQDYYAPHRVIPQVESIYLELGLAPATAIASNRV
jgi:glycosyltransferase involved in cell wall biosynthesis